MNSLSSLQLPCSCSFRLWLTSILSTVGYGQYVENLKKGMNPVRFYEYALSFSLMVALIRMLVGI